MSPATKSSEPDKLHLIREGYVAEIVHGRATGLYHFLVTRENSLEILCWGQENTLDAARHCVDEFIVSEKERFKAAS